MTTLYHSITCELDGRCAPDLAAEDRRGRTHNLIGCAWREQWERDLAVCEVADEIMEPIEAMLREVIMEDRSLPDARNDAAEAIVRTLIGSGRMPHPRGPGD